ncbi:hypothetical protein [Thermodesulfatator atlanticus]|uniref:hypothetical protein n=1 Tax=Thermodesulfatator atlanticus TaxID=501497 RepID=UPI0003B56049|nr:hypothetical protein [Thermodesulfatator atlanticus]
MAEEEKEKEKNEDQEEKDPLADLLVEEEEEGEEKEEPEESEAKKGTEAESEDAEEKDADEEVKQEKKEGPPEDFEDPLASILGEEESLEEPQEEDSKKEEKDEAPQEEQETEAEAPSRGKLVFVFWILAILIPLIFLGAGVFTLMQLMKQPVGLYPQKEKAPSKVQVPQKKEQEPEPPVVSSPIAVEGRKILFLKDFLIPYRRETGEYLFVKAKVMLYFAKEVDYLRAQKNKALFREELYRLLRNVPLYLWENPKGAKVIEREFMDYLTKKKIGDVVPVEIKISGYVLK